MLLSKKIQFFPGKGAENQFKALEEQNMGRNSVTEKWLPRL